ncbi:putative NADP-dependent oxidoreductase domain-containing protein [Seiridium cardinale]|uniref:NADP-dependent oxidoreductase domain-containing protein n=1 Tax=Seiridium cardinale TaxID=138064 RepID=A0ABR2XDU8_9PEZI
MASTYTINSTAKLNSGYEIPLLGFGVYQTPPDETEKACLEALKAGYRHIDSAVLYRNEAGVGAAIKKSGIPRSDIFFTTKVPQMPSGGLDYSKTKAQIDQSLKTAGVDYIDLYLIHSPYGGSATRKGVWKALVEAVDEGKIRSIGISNYGINHLDELEKHIAELEEERGGKGKGGVISVAQHEVHPWCARNDIAEWCAKRNILLEAYCPVVRGKRFDEPGVKKLAEKYGKSPAQILIRWSLQKGYAPLPKSVTPKRIVENAEIYDFELTKAEVDELESKEYAPIAWDPTTTGLDN